MQVERRYALKEHQERSWLSVLVQTVVVWMILGMMISTLALMTNGGFDLGHVISIMALEAGLGGYIYFKHIE